MQEIELEKTYLLKEIPAGLAECKHKELLDIYIPISSIHPILRIRKKGDDFEITKKFPVQEEDASHQIEHTIKISKEEFNELSKIPSKKVRKIRYYYLHNDNLGEFDVFQDELEGLILVDFEFKTIAEKAAFTIPDFCLTDATQKEFVAGGMLCGKNYTDIEKELEEFGYKKLFLKN